MWLIKSTFLVRFLATGITSNRNSNKLNSFITLKYLRACIINFENKYSTCYVSMTVTKITVYKSNCIYLFIFLCLCLILVYAILKG